MSSVIRSKKTAPYGSWESKIDIDSIFKSATSVAEIHVDILKNKIYHLENRPNEGGRAVLVESMSKHEISPAGFNVRTRVHEYGGAPAMVQGGFAYFTDFNKSGIWRTKTSDSKSKPEQITAESTVLRYADFVVHPMDLDCLIAVREDHTIDEPAKVVNTLVCVDASSKKEWVIASGRDFYQSPRFNRDGSRICWTEWDHPDMPWDAGELHTAKFSCPSFTSKKAPTIYQKRYIAGKPDAEAASQPRWDIASDDKLFFCWDVTGFINLYSVDLAESGEGHIRRVTPKVDYDFAGLAWSFGGSDYCQLTQRDMLVIPIINSVTTLHHLDLYTRKLTPIENDYLDFSQLKRVSDIQAVFLGSKADQGKTLTIMTLKTPSFASADFAGLWFETLDIDKTLISKPETITVKVDFPPKGHGKDTDSKKVDMHVVMYPPFNPEYQGEKDTLPPAVVNVHGGPTGKAPIGLNMNYQYFTSRGYAVLDIDYGGSSGYGREYIQRLRGNWGIVDVNDSAQAVTELGKLGKIDAKRVAIQGGSAGGFTTLASLAFNKVFSAGVSSFGVSDLELLTKDTHKFESQYLFRLVGGTPSEIPKIYHDRAPINSAEDITAPLLVLQGLDDKVVPPDQARLIVAKIEKAGGDVEAVYYKGEGHGFRMVENQKDALTRSEAWYRKVFVDKKA